MKHILLYLFIFIGSFGVANAQAGGDNDGPKREQKIQALYIAYVSQELKLTEDEAQKFWPVHTQYDAEIKAVSMDLNEIDRQQAVLNIKKKYQDRFIKIIGADRTNTFFKTDAEFRKKMIDRLKKMREQRNQNNPRGQMWKP
jgi:hypothetical protein